MVLVVPYPRMQPALASTSSGLMEGFSLMVQVQKEVARFMKGHVIAQGEETTHWS